MNVRVFLSLLLASGSSVAGSLWTEVTTPASETMVGLSSPNPDFAIGVGNNGQIIHFVNGDAGTLVPSGTSNNLFDVLAIDENFAVATGEDTVLLWDGSQWTALVEDTNTGPAQAFTPAWAPPEKDRVLYQTLGSPFNFVCPIQLPDDPGSFCRAFSRPVLTLCGSNADTKALQTSGSILRFSGGTLSNLDDPEDSAVFEQPVQQQLNLIAAYIPPEVCLPGSVPPTEIFAVNLVGSRSEFWHFNGTEWSKQADAGTDQVLTGMAGVGTGQVVAVGRQPSTQNAKGPTPANDGVVWVYNGFGWNEETLPPDAPGLADVTVSARFESLIFENGFETQIVNKLVAPPPGVSGGFWGIGEGGLLFQRPVIEIPTADLALVKTLLDPIPPLSAGNPVRVGDVIQYALEVTNLGPDEVSTAILNDVYFSSQLEFVDSDCPASITDQGTRRTASFGLTNLGPGDRITCRPRFEVLSIPVQESGAVGVLNVAEVHGSILDTNPTNNKDACLIDANEAGSDGTRVQCDVEQIFILVP